MLDPDMNPTYAAAIAIIEAMNTPKITLSEAALQERLNKEWRCGYKEALDQIRKVTQGDYKTVHDWDEYPTPLQEALFAAIAGCCADEDSAVNRLRAAAPDLLAALEEAYLDALRFLDQGDFKRNIEWDAGYIVDAIAKAKGTKEPKENIDHGSGE